LKSVCPPHAPSSASTSSNELIAGNLADIGIIVMGGLTNSVLRALERMGLADIFGDSRVPLRCSTLSIRWCQRKSANSASANAPCWWSRKDRPTTSSRR